MFQKLLINFLLIVFTLHANAQLQITCNGKAINYTAADIQYTFTTNNNFSNNSLQFIKNSEWKKIDSKKIPISFNSKSFWLKIPLDYITTLGEFNLVQIDNPHINFLRFWVLKNDSIVQTSKLTGDNTIFSTRPLPSTSFVMELNNYKNGYLIIAADKKFTKLDLPIQFNTYSNFLNNRFEKNLSIGLFVGILILLCGINAALYIAVKESIYLWYCFYLFVISCYVFINEGILFKILYPNTPFLNDVIRPSSIILSAIPLLIFFNQLLNVKKNNPLLYKWNSRVLISYGCLVVGAIISSFLQGYEMQGFWLKASNFVSPVILIYTLIQAIYFFKLKIPYASFAIASFGGFTILIIIFILGQIEVIEDNIFTSYANYISILYESTIMLFALIWRYRTNKINVETELKALEKKQQSIYKEIAIWQEKETIRFSSLLHDSVGANLAFLRLEADNMSLTEDSRVNLATNITSIANEVRNMSHTFSPILLNTKGLYESIEEKVKLINTNSTIHLLFEWFEETKKLNPQYEMMVYRIVQEILQNLLKHSKANHGLLQIILNQNFVSIYAEDDGIGFNQKENKGLGLQSIENLVQLLDGTFRIESSINDGFGISIEFNLPTDGKI